VATGVGTGGCDCDRAHGTGTEIGRHNLARAVSVKKLQLKKPKTLISTQCKPHAHAPSPGSLELDYDAFFLSASHFARYSL
jgi:hypothetical protein